MTKILVAVDKQFYKVNNIYYTDDAHPYKYWEEYLYKFSKVFVLARVKDIGKIEEDFIRADGENINFIPLPEYKGPLGLLKNIFKVFSTCFKATKNVDVLLMRSGSSVGLCLWFCNLFQKKHFAVEHGGALNESIVLAKQTKCFNTFYALLLHKLHQLQAKQAQCASYVCVYLKKLYPTKHENKEFVFSGVQIGDEIISEPRKKAFFENSENILISVGRLMPEKGHMLLVKAVEEIVKDKKQQLKTIIVGDGPELNNLEKYTLNNSLQNYIKLTGRIKWGNDLFKLLDEAKIFVIPSLTEGMPRALIEAMARGLPAIGAKVGGIPEVLPEDCLVVPNDYKALSRKILALINNSSELEEYSKINFQTAMQYKKELVQKIKNDFWQYLIDSMSR